MIPKQLRIGRHLSQEQLAQMSGLNVRTIQRIESGHTHVSQDSAGGSHVNEEWCNEMRTRPPSL